MPESTLHRSPQFPPIEPFRRGRLQVSPVHHIYFEECGNPDGLPAVVLHGGPGGGSSPFLRRFHDPKKYRIILFDQRGCGNSTPHACLEDNTTWHLVSDMEALREHLGIQTWQVFGGSWGSTLALAYAQRYADRIHSMVLRGIFLIRDWEVRWLYQEGASRVFPDAFANYVELVPKDERYDLMAAYHKRLHGNDVAQQMAFARAWSQWEGSVLSLLPDPQRVSNFGADKFALAFALIESHYFAHKGFMPYDGALLDGVAAHAHVPSVIVQGRYDMCTPPQSAFELAARWPKARLDIIADSGHSALEPGTTNALVRATNEFALI